MAKLRLSCFRRIAAAASVGFACFGSTAYATTATVLYRFQDTPDGAGPAATMILDKKGNLYGTTTIGGASNFGTVFTLARDGTETVLHSFAGNPDGATPDGGLIEGRHGNLFGTTYDGGKNGYGTVFKLASDGKLKTLYSFANGPDGSSPRGSLIVDSAGNLYGVARSGGNTGCYLGCGTVFKVSPTGTETTIYEFCTSAGQCPDGANPVGPLVMDGSGNLFGATQLGGSSGLGVVFEIAADGTESVLHNFAGQGDGGQPLAGLYLDSAGNLYGTTYGGSSSCQNGGCGTVFKISSAWKFSVLYAFAGGEDGAYPYAPVIADSAGNLYGTTETGGAVNWGTVYEVTTGGIEKVLNDLAQVGLYPVGGLVLDSRGHLYGTTSQAAGSYGTVFKLRD